MNQATKDTLQFLKNLNNNPLLKEQLLIFLKDKLESSARSMVAQKDVHDLMRYQGRAHELTEIISKIEARLD